MKTTGKYVGLDVHKDTTVIAVAEAGRTGEVRLSATIVVRLIHSFCAPVAAANEASLDLLV
jgi:hypothetical protein